jgi:hypothetical protein
VAQFGFLHAGYGEGRFAQLDVIDLGLRDPQAAQTEARLFKGLARFRLLLLLALAEVDAGQMGRANELVGSAVAMRGLTLPEHQAPFVAGAVASLIEAGCEDAPELLRCGLSTDAAVRGAVGVLPALGEHHRVLLLNHATEWLRQEFQNLKAAALTDAFSEVALAAAEIRNGSVRDTLIDTLTQVIEQVRTAVDVAVEHEDVLAGLAAIAVQTMGPMLGGESPAESTAHESDEIRATLRASLGAAMALNGLEQRGLELLERAVDECTDPGASSRSFGLVAKELRRLRSAPASAGRSRPPSRSTTTKHETRCSRKWQASFRRPRNSTPLPAGVRLRPEAGGSRQPGRSPPGSGVVRPHWTWGAKRDNRRPPSRHGRSRSAGVTCSCPVPSCSCR